MVLTNRQLSNFIDRIKLKRDNMPKYREQVKNLTDKLEDKIRNDTRTGAKVTRVILAGSWKKGTILRHTGENPIDIDVVLYVEGDVNLASDLKRLHDFIAEYLEDIYPTKDISKDVDAEGNTKSIKIVFVSSGLEVDIVPVIPLNSPAEYVWQPERGGGGKYITSVTGQLDFAQDKRQSNPSYTSVVRALKWWRNYKELKDELSSFVIELIVSHLEISKGKEQNIEEGIIRFFKFVSDPTFPDILFPGAIKIKSASSAAIYVGDPTNNENNAAKKITQTYWTEIKKEALDAFEALNIAQAKNNEGDTIEEWKYVFGPSFNVNPEN
ncbi:MAG: CBASS oligonucleotide cyclase [Bacteroidota bacterium]|nr:CBASS oligonucleotide cyclase [Bacteroidota bacterium]